eukprot:2954035-Heterocapsa_arctica.AAC.1
MKHYLKLAQKEPMRTGALHTSWLMENGHHKEHTNDIRTAMGNVSCAKKRCGSQSSLVGLPCAE